MDYSFPGNVRELETPSAAPWRWPTAISSPLSDLPPDIEELKVDTLAQQEFVTLEQHEKAYISKVLKATRGNRTKAARLLDLPRTSLWRKIRKYALSESPSSDDVSD
jgi:transcriptional regulator of acetoin/glycerol metabolism